MNKLLLHSRERVVTQIGVAIVSCYINSEKIFLSFCYSNHTKNYIFPLRENVSVDLLVKYIKRFLILKIIINKNSTANSLFKEYIDIKKQEWNQFKKRCRKKKKKQ